MNCNFCNSLATTHCQKCLREVCLGHAVSCTRCFDNVCPKCAPIGHWIKCVECNELNNKDKEE